MTVKPTRAPDYAIWWYAATKYDKENMSQSISKEKINIDLMDFLNFLYDQGFRYTKIYDNGILFRVTNNRILEEIETAQVRQFVVKWIEGLPPFIYVSSRDGQLTAEIPRKLLMEKIIHGVGYFFDTKKLEAVLGPKEHFKMCQDEETTKYVYFINGYLHINTKGIEFCDYAELPGYIWASEIIQHTFNIEQGRKDTGHVKRFFNLVANGATPAKAISKEEQTSRADRFADLCCIAGYLAHAYTSYKLQAVLLTDVKISESNEPNGRSGKTLFLRLVGGLLCADPTKPGKTFVEIAGKNFDPTDKHKYDRASHETKLISINDVKRGFRTEWLFNDITDGLEVNKKNQQPFIILAKMAVISNLPIELGGSSNADRFCVFEFSDYFNEKHDPEKEFGTWFLSNKWAPAEFDKYYYFIAQCVQLFFAEGRRLPKPAAINYGRRTLQTYVGTELLAYIEEDWQPIAGVAYEIKTQYQEFINLYPDYAKLQQKKFTESLKKYMNHAGKFAPFNKEENTARNAEGQRFIIFKAIKTAE